MKNCLYMSEMIFFNILIKILNGLCFPLAIYLSVPLTVRMTVSKAETKNYNRNSPEPIFNGDFLMGTSEHVPDATVKCGSHVPGTKHTNIINCEFFFLEEKLTCLKETPLSIGKYYRICFSLQYKYHKHLARVQHKKM